VARAHLSRNRGLALAGKGLPSGKLEENSYLERGVAEATPERVAKIIRIGRELGNEPATPEEARRSSASKSWLKWTVINRLPPQKKGIMRLDEHDAFSSV